MMTTRSRQSNAAGSFFLPYSLFLVCTHARARAHASTLKKNTALHTQTKHTHVCVALLCLRARTPRPVALPLFIYAYAPPRSFALHHTALHPTLITFTAPKLLDVRSPLFPPYPKRAPLHALFFSPPPQSRAECTRTLDARTHAPTCAACAATRARVCVCVRAPGSGSRRHSRHSRRRRSSSSSTSSSSKQQP